MSEYWVSKKKYWCQYCDIFIADDAPSRSQHENGLRHKGNKDRFIRSLYKTSIKKQQDSEEEKREMKRVEEAARVAYARDVGSGLGTSTASSSSLIAPVSTPKPKPPPKPSNPYANYTTAASLGISDPEVERYIIETASRQTEGRAGEWMAVAPPPPPLPQEATPSSPVSGTELKVEPRESVSQIRKRADEAPADEEDIRRFKIRKKTISVGLGEIYDPGIIQTKPKTVKPEILTDSSSEQLNAPQVTNNGMPTATEKPKWINRGWKRAGEPTSEDAGASALQNLSEDVKANVETSPKEQASRAEDTTNDNVKSEIKNEFVNEIKKEHADISTPSSSTSGLFRKRKAPAISSAGRRKDR